MPVPKSMRQQGETFDLGFAGGNLELDLTGDRFDRGAGVDRIDLGALNVEPVLARPVQDHLGRFGVTGGRDDGQDEPRRATQNMALDAPDFLVAVVSRSPCCGPETTLCEIPVVGSDPWA